MTTQVDRRSLLAAGAALAVAPALPAEPVTAERLPLWPGRPPGGEGVSVADEFVLRTPGGSADDIAWTHLATPYLKVTRPARPDGRAVLIIPGGGYARIAIGRAPSSLALLYARAGVAAFELLYRLPHDRWAAGPDAPLQDAQRAVRLIRSGAGGASIDPARLLAIGFSAGGHLVGRLGQRADAATYPAIDAADRLSARPQVIGMFFPVVTMGTDAHGPSRRELLGEGASDIMRDAYSLERHVGAGTPPTALFHNADDATVRYTNSLMMFAALQAARIPSELMIAEAGGHGPRLIEADGRPHPWFGLLDRFAARHGWTA